MNRHNRYNEVNPLNHYFSSDSAIYKIIEDMREGFLNNECRKFNVGLVERATSEVRIKGKALDASTYPFAKDLNRHMYKGKVRVLMLVDGKFGGSESIESIIPIDLGNNPYELFKNVYRGTTIDEYVTEEKTREFIKTNRGRLLEKGFSYFEVDRSRFFYLKEKDLKKFKKGNNRFDMARLVPLITPTQGYVVLESVKKPTLDGYMTSAPLFTSYRLKQSVTRKLLSKLRSENPTEIKDWVAHRIIVDTIEEVKDLENFLKSPPKIGGSKVEYLYTQDYYNEIKGSGFKAVNVTVRVTSRGYEPCVREIQLIDKKQYYLNEFVEGKTSHNQHEKKQMHRPRSKRNVNDYYQDILEKIFGSEEMRISIL